LNIHRQCHSDVNGVFYPCEKMVLHDDLSIGNIKDGLKKEKIIEFMNIGQLTEFNCKHCWAMRF